MSWFKKLQNGLKNTSSKIGGGITGIFTRAKLDNQSLEELEELLIMSDLGAETSAQIIDSLAKNKFDKDITEAEIKKFLSDEITAILEPFAKPLEITNSPHIVIVVGVNGNGKTTTIGKLANLYKSQGKKVLIVAADTFRAAAVGQLKTWAERSKVSFFEGKDQQDPASVVYQGIEKAKTDGADLVLIDTAGRLQNKLNLMTELGKIIGVCSKLIPDSPHNVVMVLDATTGQNAISQVTEFGSKAGVSGLIVTKLDGTAKGGIVVALAKKFALPIHAIGVGEGIDDLQAFNAKDFADSLVGNNS